MMELALDSSIFSNLTFDSTSISTLRAARQIVFPVSQLLGKHRYPCRFTMKYSGPFVIRNALCSRFGKQVEVFDGRKKSRFLIGYSRNGNDVKEEVFESKNVGFMVLAKKGVLLAAVVCGIMVFRCRRVAAIEGIVNARYSGLMEKCVLQMKNALPVMLQILRLFKEQGLILVVLFSLSAFFSMAETSITTLWPWKVRELAEKEPENGVFRMLQSDVTRFLTTILIGTTVVNIGATALVTEAATAIFGEAGVSAATGVMTACAYRMFCMHVSL